MKQHVLHKLSDTCICRTHLLIAGDGPSSVGVFLFVRLMSSLRHFVFWMLFAFLNVSSVTSGKVWGGNKEPPPRGSEQCPCLDSTSGLFASGRAKLQELGYPSGYGTKGGCQRHSDTLQLDGCDGIDPPLYCSSPWCFVDPATCRGHESQPVAALAKLAVNISDIPYYSYTTCGALDRYARPDIMMNKIRGKTMRMSVSYPQPPWILVDEADPLNPHWKGHTGVLPTVMAKISDHASLNISLRDYFASEQSRTVFPGSSFSACAMDVRVGKVDACVGNFWVTSERLAVADFVQPFAQDYLYLVTTYDEVCGRTIVAMRCVDAQLWVTCCRTNELIRPATRTRKRAACRHLKRPTIAFSRASAHEHAGSTLREARRRNVKAGMCVRVDILARIFTSVSIFGCLCQTGAGDCVADTFQAVRALLCRALGCSVRIHHACHPLHYLHGTKAHLIYY